MAPDAKLAGAISAHTLRKLAEAQVYQDRGRHISNAESALPQSAQETLHELRVHQIELEMQNEELQRSQINLDMERSKYFDLYDTAPVGYCTLSEGGLILQSNLTASNLLGVPRNVLITQRFSSFIQSRDQDIFYLHCKRLLSTGQPQQCDLHMLPKFGPMVWIKLIFTLASRVNERHGMRVVLIDVNQRMSAEHALRQSEQALRTSERQMAIAQKMGGTGSWTYDLATGRISGSAEWLRIVGCPARTPDFALQEIEACAEERDRVHAALMALIDEGQAYDIEYAIQPADGSLRRIVHAVAILDMDADGNASRVLGFVQDITALQQLNAQIRQLAFLDPLTQLPNRRLFMDRLAQAMATGQRTSRFSALMFLDLDNFKPLNDLHGHEAGDTLLNEVAKRLNHCVREVDTVARIGGDEFVVLLGDLNSDAQASTEQALGIAEKVRAALAVPYVLAIRSAGAATTKAVEHQCSASIGVVIFGKSDQNPDDILKRADAAMYQAKDRGRNLVRIFEPPP